MFEEKESFWRKKGFYLSACVLLVCIMAVGAICYRKINGTEQDNNMMADIATEVPAATATPAEDGTLSSEEDTAQANASLDEKVSEAEKGDEKEETTKNNPTATPKSTEKTIATSKPSSEKKESSTASAKKYSFDDEKGLLWPVSGDVILKYSMNNAIYFKTLAQYKCNPGIAISAETGTKVKAAADGKITKISEDEEYGKIITMDIGSDYTLKYGQLTDITVKKGDEVKEGDTIASIAEPTKYFTEEGSNLYFQVLEKEESVDPLLLLR